MHVATNYYQMLQLARHHYGAANIDSSLTDHFTCSSDLAHPVQSQMESSFVRKSSFPRILVSVAVACCIRAFHELEHTYLRDMHYRWPEFTPREHSTITSHNTDLTVPTHTLLITPFQWTSHTFTLQHTSFSTSRVWLNYSVLWTPWTAIM